MCVHTSKSEHRTRSPGSDRSQSVNWPLIGIGIVPSVPHTSAALIAIVISARAHPPAVIQIIPQTEQDRTG